MTRAAVTSWCDTLLYLAHISTSAWSFNDGLLWFHLEVFSYFYFFNPVNSVHLMSRPAGWRTSRRFLHLCSVSSLRVGGTVFVDVLEENVFFLWFRWDDWYCHLFKNTAVGQETLKFTNCSSKAEINVAFFLLGEELSWAKLLKVTNSLVCSWFCHY